MAKGYSKDLRARAVALVEEGAGGRAGRRRREQTGSGAGARSRRLDRNPLDRALGDNGQCSGIARHGPQSLAARGASPVAASNGASRGGDKQNSLVQLMTFAAQHQMHWVNLGMNYGNNRSYTNEDILNRDTY